MKITDYQKITELSPTSVFLVDGPSGTKTIFGRDLLKALNGVTASRDSIGTLDLSQLERIYKFEDSDNLLIGRSDGNVVMDAKDLYFSMIDAFIPNEQRRKVFRGKNLGAALTSEQKTEIKNGTFKGLFVGDYWEIGGRIWRIADIDYWYRTGDLTCFDHHVVVMPDEVLYTASMHDSDTTNGGYWNSKMRKTGLDEAKTIVNAAFGEDNILSHRDQFEHAVSNGWSNGVNWETSTVEIPTEPMIYGAFMMAAGSDGSEIYHRQTTSMLQLSLMDINRQFITTSIIDNKSGTYWTRDIVSPTSYASISRLGAISRSPASDEIGVRPVFGISG